MPEGYYYQELPFGMQLLDQEPERDIPDECSFYQGEFAYTVLITMTPHRSIIFVFYADRHGTLKLLQKGNIECTGSEDLVWIEKIVNKHIAEQWQQREQELLTTLEELQKPIKLTNVPDAKWTEMADLVRANPKKALQSILDALG
jgi:hypothetical protein